MLSARAKGKLHKAIFNWSRVPVCAIPVPPQLPWATLLPRAMTTTWSHSCCTSGMMWVEKQCTCSPAGEARMAQRFAQAR